MSPSGWSLGHVRRIGEGVVDARCSRINRRHLGTLVGHPVWPPEAASVVAEPALPHRMTVNGGEELIVQSTYCSHESYTSDGVTRVCRSCGISWVDGPLTGPECPQHCPYRSCTLDAPCHECCRCAGVCLIHND